MQVKFHENHRKRVSSWKKNDWNQKTEMIETKIQPKNILSYIGWFWQNDKSIANVDWWEKRIDSDKNGSF